jgi:hypothetical protein
VLSVVAQQLLVLRHARLAAAPRIVFEGRAIFVKEHHVIVTVRCIVLTSTISVLCSTWLHRYILYKRLQYLKAENNAVTVYAAVCDAMHVNVDEPWLRRQERATKQPQGTHTSSANTA